MTAAAPPPDPLDWHCAITGSGQTPLICVPGWGCEGSQFEELGQILGANYRVYRPDLPGHGKTPLGNFQPGFENYSKALADWTRKQNLPNPIFVGHSMGGVLALMTANRVQARAVVNLDGSLPAAAGALAGLTRIREWLPEPDLRQRLASVFRKQFFLRAERDARAAQIVQTMISVPDPVLRFLPKTAASLNPKKILSELRMPILFVSAQSPRFDAGQAKNLLPQLALEHLQETGHFLHVYAAEKVGNIIETFLSPITRITTADS